jgi:hypothetical protein
MYQTISRTDFHDAFRDMGRGKQFSYEGKNALLDYLEELEDETGEPIELDVIALCCDYTEYDNLEAFQSDYGDEYKNISDIEDATTVIPIEGTDGFIIQQF